MKNSTLESMDWANKSNEEMNDKFQISFLFDFNKNFNFSLIYSRGKNFFLLFPLSLLLRWIEQKTNEHPNEEDKEHFSNVQLPERKKKQKEK